MNAGSLQQRDRQGRSTSRSRRSLTAENSDPASHGAVGTMPPVVLISLREEHSTSDGQRRAKRGYQGSFL